MSVSRRQIHALVDIVDPRELDAVYHLLTKFVEEDAPTPEELEGIAKGRADFRAGRSYAEEEIDWDNLRGMKFDDESEPEEKP